MMLEIDYFLNYFFRDVWYILVDSLWADFSVPRSPNRPVPLVDAVPLAVWMYAKPKGETTY